MTTRIQWDSHHGPAINVKDQTLYSFDLPEDEAQAIYDGVAELFWEAANELAKEHDYAGVYSEGRMGGWLVPHYPRGSNIDAWTDHLGSDEPEYIAEVAKFEAFGADVVALLDHYVEYARTELQAAVEEEAGKAALLELGTPVRWTR